MTRNESPRITITLGDDNGTAAPLYEIYAQQYQPQPAYLEFDPDAEGLSLEAGYSGEIGGGIPERIWNGVELRFTVPAAISRGALEGLANDEKLAELLETIKAGYEYDYNGPKGRYTDAAQAAFEAIEQHLASEELAEVWDAIDWVTEGVYVVDAAKHETIELYANEFEDDEPNRVINGDIPSAVAKALANILERIPSDAQAKKVAAMLSAFDADKYGYLLEDFED